MSNVVYLVIGLALGGIPSLLLLVWLRRGADLSRPLAELERKLSETFHRANADMAARVEQIKGDLRTDLADRLQTGLAGVRATVDRQLAEGRNEQALRLTETAAVLERGFEKLRSSTESKFERLQETQAAAAREARSELTRSLGETTSELQKKFESLEAKTVQNLEIIRGKMDERLQSISEQVQQKLERNIQEGFAHFQKVQEHLKAAEEQLRNVGTVGHSINELNSLLKMPHLRGRFGEAELGKLLADFLPAGAYEEQVCLVPDSKEAVDAVVKFPQAKLPIDSKFNREQILGLFDTSDPQRLKEARKQLAGVIKQQAQSISDKYIHPEHGTTDLALMFLPSETIYFEVIRHVELCEALHRLNVFPVSPNTLAITLKSVAMSFGFYEFAKNVEKTLEQIKQAQRSFGHFQHKFEEVGKGLEKAQQAYGTAAGHLNRYTNRVVRLTGEPVPENGDGAPKSLPSADSDPSRELRLDYTE
ncbi:MAG TPA: DNA recombination protein RmuC [Candidatus Sulfotelmatobacter sp.]|nr:DNA recombination protein RmuC [Candidatus Sulfotelmatobacter sp.]HWI58484.1 DNA recombination protein RmuC [Bacillota bacterium]